MSEIVVMLRNLKWRAKRAWERKLICTGTYGDICMEVDDLIKSVSILEKRDV
jgi:hypothetical protein